MPFCPQCGVDNPAGARYCDQCGAMLVPVPAQAAPPPVAPTAAIPAIGPTVCPQCGQAVIPGEAFCDNCGAPLSAPARPVAPVPSPPQSAAPPQPVYPPPALVTAPSSYQASVAPPAAPPPATPSAPPVPSVAPPPAIPSAPPSYQAPPSPPAPAVPPMTPAPVSGRTTLASCVLVVMGTGAVLPLPAASQALVGRSDPVSKFYPDVDLGPHGALDQGVGRRHARIFVQSGQVMIEDLDSVNGTLVNGQRVLPHQSRALSNGDQITLGRMLLRFQA
ncbi:FHA domain-containing protein [Roseiflexus castenholzii]|uniref:FHA domain-containing protein n=1 Tax=Roseiflexus castenholzii TaxID=120962 RepID=UPI003C7ECB14